MTVKQYQKIHEVTEAIYLDNVDKVAYTIMHLLGYSETQVDGMTPAMFLRLMKRTEKMISRTNTRPWYYRPLPTDATKITLGQFIETIHWIKNGEIDQLHLIAATMRHGKDHAKDAAKFLAVNVRRILFDVMQFIDSVETLVKSYPGLFPPPQKQDDDVKPAPVPKFIEQYGWVYSAKQVAEMEGCTLEQAYDLPVIQAFNDLAYLKSKQAFDEQMAKK